MTDFNATFRIAYSSEARCDHFLSIFFRMFRPSLCRSGLNSYNKLFCSRLRRRYVTRMSNSNRFEVSASWMGPVSHRTKCRPKP
jgi:hypothetical protein